MARAMVASTNNMRLCTLAAVRSKAIASSLLASLFTSVESIVARLFFAWAVFLRAIESYMEIDVVLLYIAFAICRISLTYALGSLG